MPQPESAAARSITCSARGDFAEQTAAELDRIDLCRGRKLIDEALDDDSVARRSDTTPERGRDGERLLAHVVDVRIGKVVVEVDRPLDGIEIESSL